MVKKILGRTGISVTPVGMGTLTMGFSQKNLDIKAGSRVIVHAVEQGINFLDTAQYDWKAAVADRIKRGICSDAGAVWHVPWNCGRHRSCKDESVYGYLSGVV